MKNYLIFGVIALVVLFVLFHDKIKSWFHKPTEEVAPLAEKKEDEGCLRETMLGGKKIMVPCRSSIVSDADAIYIQDVMNATSGLPSIQANFTPTTVNQSDLVPSLIL